MTRGAKAHSTSIVCAACSTPSTRSSPDPMPTFDDVEQIVAGLPEVTVGKRFGHRTWFVAGKSFAWERPYSKADLKRFGDETPPDGPILAVTVEDLEEKEAVLGRRPARHLHHRALRQLPRDPDPAASGREAGAARRHRRRLARRRSGGVGRRVRGLRRPPTLTVYDTCSIPWRGAASSRAVVDGQRRTSGAGRRPRPPGSRAGRPVRLRPRQGRPGCRRALRARAGRHHRDRRRRRSPRARTRLHRVHAGPRRRRHRRALPRGRDQRGDDVGLHHRARRTAGTALLGPASKPPRNRATRRSSAPGSTRATSPCWRRCCRCRCARCVPSPGSSVRTSASTTRRTCGRRSASGSPPRPATSSSVTPGSRRVRTTRSTAFPTSSRATQSPTRSASRSTASCTTRKWPSPPNRSRPCGASTTPGPSPVCTSRGRRHTAARPSSPVGSSGRWATR